MNEMHEGKPHPEIAEIEKFAEQLLDHDSEIVAQSEFN